MCGIFCCVSQDSENVESSDEWNMCQDFIKARGPDKSAQRFVPLSKPWFGHFAASILWMQGLQLTDQPLVDSHGNILLWNGDIFSGSLAKAETCDALTVLNAFGTCSKIMHVLRDIQGPYSFIYFQKSSNLLYFGRDIVGRHSLLVYLNNKQSTITLTSVGSKQFKNIVEVPAIGTFVINLSNPKMNLACYPWKEPNSRLKDIIEELNSALHIDIEIKNTMSELDLCNKLMKYLNPIVKDVEYLENDQYLGDFNKTIEYLLKNEIVCSRIEHLSKLLYDSVKVRITTKPNFCKDCILLVLKGDNVTCEHAKIGILFSGGLDSAILSLIADKYVSRTEPIDLINVAFEKTVNVLEKNKKHNKNSKSCIEAYDTPDRKTGRQTLSELLQICPDREWNFIEINVTQEELQTYRSLRIGDLLYPLSTILDESLGCALWFASRAKGILPTTNVEYESPCRVLLLGMGADELFGGYMRHRTILKHKGWIDLGEELELELDRISQRNLGRDDRVVSDHGRQSRLPYLDENLIDYVRRLKPWERCYPTDKMPPGLGDKLLLRLLARKLGFQKTATFPKRAFQFGSRIANSKENAKNISKRL